MNLCMTWLQEALRGAKTTDQGLSPHRSVLLCGLTGRMAPAGGSGSPFCSTSTLVPLRCFTPHSCWLKSLEPERVLLLSLWLTEWLSVLVCIFHLLCIIRDGRGDSSTAGGHRSTGPRSIRSWAERKNERRPGFLFAFPPAAHSRRVVLIHK